MESALLCGNNPVPVQLLRPLLPSRSVSAKTGRLSRSLLMSLLHRAANVHGARFVSLLLVPVAALSQTAQNLPATPPTAGDLLQQQGNRGQSAPGLAPPSSRETLNIRRQKPAAEVSGKKPARQLIWVEQIVLEGAQLLPSGAADSLLGEYVQKNNTVDQLTDLTQKLEALHLQAGYLVRVRLPQQTISQGVLILTVEDVVFGGVKIDNPGRRASSQRLEEMVLTRQPGGQTVSLSALESAVLAINDLPGVQTQASMVSNPTSNKPELLLKMSDKPTLSGSAGLDNFGSRATGTERLQANLTLASPFGQSEAFRFAGFKTEGTGFARAAATVPLGYRGLTVGANVSRLDYRLTQDAFRNLNIRGDATLYGLEAQMPFIQTASMVLQAGLSIEQRNFNNLANTQIVSAYGVRANTLSVSGLMRHGSNAYSTGLIAATAGRVDLDGSPNRSADSQFANTQGSYRKWRASAAHVRSLDAQWTFQTAAQLQAAQRNLDPSERFILGGPQGVRGYPIGEGSGSNARLVQLELRRNLGKSTDGALLYDWGQVETFEDNSRNLTPVNRYILKSAGLQLSHIRRITNQQDVQFRLIAAHALGDHPNPGPDGNNQDGSSKRNRLWLDASFIF